MWHTYIGKFNGIGVRDLFQRMFDDYGALTRLPAIFGRPALVISFEPDDFEKIFRTEGVWPMRRGIETFEYYRKKVRPEVFKGYAGLASDQGETWGKLRTVVNPVMMQPKVTKSYVEPVDAISREFIGKVRRMRDGKGEMPDDFGQELNQWSMESIGVIALDQRLGVMADERQPETEQIIKVLCGVLLGLFEFNDTIILLLFLIFRQ